ncbi:PBP1A family penicillin-binding protein [candidate division KSB3 bacterium]|uniref:Penicillin-binding protein 1A n=1 Tax=candidate division KSB3 bacterium TaxID=2044937 RepID=A0A9D5Q6V5_9BACT|nr:PBP1A family penicillin-binding protein [candidate division KSB3 bacterium]MBD3326264.1 PBP1A family penicillin-binding protein [candidate division KSB3 bacterium]
MKHTDHPEHPVPEHHDPQSTEKTADTPNKPPRKRSFFRKILRLVWGLIIASLILSAIMAGIAGGTLYSLYRELPNIDRLEKFRPSLVTRVYDQHNELIGEFFIEKRALVSFNELPEDFVNALLAVEDKRFFDHFGIDLIGFARAALKNIQTRSFAEGASTITQQLTRVLFLSPEKKIPRKIKEMMLAIQIEQKYRDLEAMKQQAKQKILELYANQLYLGHGAYGVQAAAKLYFGKQVWELDLGECAMLAGLPQRPAAYSPITHPEAAKKRQRHVLNRMVAEGYITPEEMQVAFDKPFEKKELPDHQINKAPYFVEHVRQYLEERYGWRVYQDGLQVYTTLDLHLQDVAREALRQNLREIQKRHGFKLIDKDKSPEEIEEKLQRIQRQEWKNPPKEGEILHAIVTAVSSSQINVRLADYTGTIEKKGFEWIKKDPTNVLKPDDIILVKVDAIDPATQTLQLTLELEPLLEGALASIDPKTGYILAMIGGYDFYRSKFNRAVQALRQPGSSFKPFVYLTALERGLTPADIIVDEPVTFVIDEERGQTWSPRNFSGDHKGPMTLRHALETSTNVVAAKLIDQIGPRAVVETARKLGITSHLNPYPSLALGGSEVYLLEMVSAYSAFANQGYHVEPIFVTKVLDSDGNILEENEPRAKQVLPENLTYILVSMMEGVVQRGTATRAKKLGRPLAGKTGTTNDNTDAWFVGYSPSLATGVWVGYDENRKSIGYRETGGRVALPIWIEFMEEALKDTPIEEFPIPSGVSFVQIEPQTGLRADPRCGGEVFTEVFRKGTEPKEYCYQAWERGYSSYAP